MITSLVGRTFLKAFNEKYNKSYSAKEFFEKEYFPLFFDHPKYMQWITNSPFVQGITTDDFGAYGKEIGKVKISNIKEYEEKFSNAIKTFGKERVTTKTEKSKNLLKIILKNDKVQRLNRLEEFHLKVSSGAKDGSIAIGYPASEETDYGAYSGLVSDLDIKTTSDDIYCSWIGNGLAIGVAGGYSLLINDPEITLTTYEGWHHYRRYLNDPTLEKLGGNQVNTWNGQWLTFRYGKRFSEDFTLVDLEQEKIMKIDTSLAKVNTVNWSNLFFSLSHRHPQKTLNAYVFSIGEKNKTIGFIPIYLKAGRTLKNIFQQLFHSEAPFQTRDFQSLFGMHIKRACELGSIGLQALRPDSLKKYMNESSNLNFKKEEQILLYQSYKTWLIAMLSKNKEQITDYTLELAALILRYRKNAKGTTGTNLINKELFAAISKRPFIEALTKMIPDMNGEDLESLKKLKDEVHLMTNEEFGYFNTLLKFDYAFIEKQS